LTLIRTLRSDICKCTRYTAPFG